MIKRLIPVLVLVVLFVGCPCTEWSNPVSPSYPCGTRAHQCRTGGCCWNYQVCGGDVPNCRPDACCYKGGDLAGKPDGGERPDAESREPMKQWQPS